MQNKKFLKFSGGLVLITIAFLLGISVGKEYQTPDNAPIAQNQPQASASLMIDYGDGRIKTYESLSGSTVFDVLKQASEKNGVDLKYKNYGGDMGVFVELIDGVGNDPAGKKWWQYWVNNKYSQVGAGSYSIQPGDVIEFKFIEGQE